MSDAITFRKMDAVFKESNNPGKEPEGYIPEIESATFTDVLVERQDIILVERDEYDPEEALWVYTRDNNRLYYPLDEENDQEEQEYLISFSADRDYTSRSY